MTSNLLFPKTCEIVRTLEYPYGYKAAEKQMSNEEMLGTRTPQRHDLVLSKSMIY
jgi:hypothetical protein